MNNFSEWTQRVAPVPSLKLDPRNPRLPDTGKEPEVREIVAELIQRENIFGLARDIADQGYFPSEILIAITAEDGASIVIEGNRRLAALKLLLSPELAPDDQQKRFQLLKHRVDPKRIREVPVLFAPSREAAAPLIISRHTERAVKSWLPMQQAKYIRSLAAPDMAIEDLAKLLGMDRAALVDNLRTDAMYQIACRLDLAPADAANVRNPREFNTSVFERLMQSASVQEFLGIAFDDRQRPRSVLKPEEFQKAFKRMVSDIASRAENTRTLNSAKDIERYLAQLGDDAPDPTRGEPHDPGPASTPDSPTPAKPARRTPKGPATPRPTASLIPRGLRSQLNVPRINAIFQELRGLKVATFPNATAVLLRIFLEMVTSHYLDKTKKIQPLLATAKRKGKGNDWYPTLRQMLDALLKDGDITLGPQVRRRLNKMVSQDDHPLSLDEIDQFVHSRFAVPTEAHLRSFWGILEDLITFLLVEPPPPAKPGSSK
ncbi:MAG: hypothetical protein IT372_11615 [Polyangiaceae bacterium]|nr:hypothetical protein [Polyangiaceae bacterium]